MKMRSLAAPSATSHVHRGARLTKVDHDSVIEISSAGKFTAASHAAVVQVITLAGINLVGSFTNDNQVINDLLARGKLITDVSQA